MVYLEKQVNDLKNIIAYENANIQKKFRSWERKKEAKNKNALNEKL